MNEIKEVTELTIDRTKWLRNTGENYECGRLLNDAGKMCCLGFLTLASGFSSERILNKLMPKAVGFVPKCSRIDDDNYFSTEFASRASIINDDDETSDAEKEIDLTNLFAENGIKLTFIN